MSERTEGWGFLANGRKAHYFREARSLCGAWMAFGGVIWCRTQAESDKPGMDDCAGCFKKRAKERLKENAPR